MAARIFYSIIRTFQLSTLNNILEPYGEHFWSILIIFPLFDTGRVLRGRSHITSAAITRQGNSEC